MGSRMTEFLRTWHREKLYAEDTDWIFPNGLIDASYRGRAGLHAFRHSLATVLITEEQVDPKTAQGVLRHANSDITM